MGRMTPAAIKQDAFLEALHMAKKFKDEFGFAGYGVVCLSDGDGQIKDIEPFANLITTAGDQYYTTKGAVGVAPAGITAPTVMSGMKLGSGTTAAAKSGAGANLVTYISGSNNPFDASFPTVTAVGGDGGWNLTYKTSWAAGDVTNAAITEAVITNAAATDSAAEAAAGMCSRTVFAAKNKTVDDSLAITWVHKFLGA